MRKLLSAQEQTVNKTSLTHARTHTEKSILASSPSCPWLQVWSGCRWDGLVPRSLSTPDTHSSSGFSRCPHETAGSVTTQARGRSKPFTAGETGQVWLPAATATATAGTGRQCECVDCPLSAEQRPKVSCWLHMTLSRRPHTAGALGEAVYWFEFRCCYILLAVI